MHRNTLTWLGCSGSLVLSLLSVSPAQAESPPRREIVFAAPEAEPEITANSADCTCSQFDVNYSSPNSVDPEGDLAIARLGCDCAGCRNILRQMVEAGDLTLFK
jgi:hypothetical protein